MHCERPHQRGVSMIEAAVALTVLALLTVLGLPSFQAWMQDTQIRNAAESIANGVRLARAEAVRRNQPTRFTLVALDDPRTMDDRCAASSAGRSWVVSVDDPAGRCAAAASATAAPRIVQAHAAGDGHAGAVVSAVDDGGTAAATVTFDGFGRVVDAAPIARIDVEAAASGDYRVLRVLVGAAGAVRVCDPAVADPSDLRVCP